MNDHTAELAVIGACLTSTRALVIARAAIAARDFSDPRLVKVWRTLTAAADAGDPTDDPHIMSQSGEEEVCQAALGTVTSDYMLPTYLERLADLGRARRLLHSVSQTITAAQAGKVVAADVLPAIRKSCELALADVPDSGSSIGEVAASIIADVEDRAANGTRAAIPTGLRCLDELIGGWRPGELIVIAGQTSLGKTALACTLARHAAIAGHPVLICSLEMTRREVGQRILALDDEAPTLAMYRMDRPDQMARAAARNAASRVQGIPLRIEDNGRMRPCDVRAAALAMPGVKLIVVDYLQIMRPDTRNASRERDVADMATSMKSLAKEANATVLLLSQLNRSVDSRADGRPRLSDLRDSGQIEQDADAVAFVWRANRQSDQGEIILAKQRGGRTGVATARYIGPRCRWEDQF